MITEDYVSFETAKLLKEKGFDEPCDCYINGIFPNTITRYSDYGIKRKNSDKTDVYSAPTLQMAMKWLREVHRLHCNIGYDNVNWYWDVQTVRKPVTEDTAPKMLPAIATIGLAYNTYEEACEAAIKCCLEDLI